MDGSGKTTQIASLLKTLHAGGVKTCLLAFWDHVVVAARYREGFVHRVFKSERGIGAPGKPVRRRDKNVRGWHLSLVRHFLYLLDALHLRLVVTRERRRHVAQVIVVDRYIYDELSNLNLANPVSRVFVKFVRAIVPQPDIAYLLDADSEAAYARKPEYPAEFMEKCRQAYFELAKLLGTMTTIPALSLSDAKKAVLKVAEDKLAENGRNAALTSQGLTAA